MILAKKSRQIHEKKVTSLLFFLFSGTAAFFLRKMVVMFTISCYFIR